MRNTKFLSMEHIEILLKYYYLRRYSRVAVDENMTAEKVKRIKENALRIIRLAYSPSYMKGLRFAGEIVLEDMAERADMEPMALYSIFEKYISDGLSSRNRKYWVRIKSKGPVPTPAELLDFIYDKYEIEIEGVI